MLGGAGGGKSKSRIGNDRKLDAYQNRMTQLMGGDEVSFANTEQWVNMSDEDKRVMDNILEEKIK